MRRRKPPLRVAKAARLAAIYLLWLERGRCDTGEIAKALGVTRRTAQRYVREVPAVAALMERL